MCVGVWGGGGRGMNHSPRTEIPATPQSIFGGTERAYFRQFAQSEQTANQATHCNNALHVQLIMHRAFCAAICTLNALVTCADYRSPSAPLSGPSLSDVRAFPRRRLLLRPGGRRWWVVWGGFPFCWGLLHRHAVLARSPSSLLSPSVRESVLDLGRLVPSLKVYAAHIKKELFVPSLFVVPDLRQKISTPTPFARAPPLSEH